MLVLREGRCVNGVAAGHARGDRFRERLLRKQDHTGIDQAGRDLVVRERIADELARVVRVGARREWIVELPGLVAEVTREVGVGRNPEKGLAPPPEREALVADEEERPIPAVVLRKHHGPSEGGAELVLPERALAGHKSAPSVQDVVTQEFPGGAVELVRAGLRDDVDDPSQRAADLGLVVVRLDLELLDSVDDGRHRIGAGEGALVVDPVEHEEVAAVVLAVDRREDEGGARRRGRAESARVLRDADGRNTRGQSQQLGEVPPVQRQVRYLLPRDGSAQLGRGALDLSAHSLYLDLLVDLPDLEAQVKSGRLVHHQGERLELVGPEAGHAGFQRVGAGLNVQEQIVPYFVGDRRSLDPGLDAAEQDIGARDNRSRRVPNRAIHRGGGDLAVRGR